MNRNQKILAGINPSQQVGLEIGPLFSPIVTRAMGPVRYVDHASTEALRAKYAHDPNVNVAAIVEVDYVWGEQRLDQLTAADAPFDYVIASHVIEHVPDLIGWLQEIHQILKPGGILSLAIPDKRSCFDYQRPVSRPSDVVDAFLRGARKPSPRQIFDHLASAVTWRGAIAWDGLPNETELVPVHTLEEAWQRAHTAYRQDSYCDVHCWVFTSASFIDLLRALIRLGLLDYRIAHFFDTTGCEFYVSLEALDLSQDAETRKQAQFASLPHGQTQAPVGSEAGISHSDVAPSLASGQPSTLSLIAQLKQSLPPPWKRSLKQLLKR